MTPPDGIRVYRIPAGGRAHSRYAITSSACSPCVSQPGTCTAPGAISVRGRANKPDMRPRYPRLPRGERALFLPFLDRGCPTEVWRDLHQSAQAEQVENIALDLQPAGEPGFREAAGIGGDSNHVVTLGREPDLGGGVPVGLNDRVRSVLPEPGEEGDAEIRNVAAERAVQQVGLPCLGVKQRQPVGESLKRLAALFGGCHRTPFSSSLSVSIGRVVVRAWPPVKVAFLTRPSTAPAAQPSPWRLAADARRKE